MSLWLIFSRSGYLIPCPSSSAIWSLLILTLIMSGGVPVGFNSLLDYASCSLLYVWFVLTFQLKIQIRIHVRRRLEDLATWRLTMTWPGRKPRDRGFPFSYTLTSSVSYPTTTIMTSIVLNKYVFWLLYILFWRISTQFECGGPPSLSGCMASGQQFASSLLFKFVSIFSREQSDTLLIISI